MVAGKGELISIQASFLIESHFKGRVFEKTSLDCGETSEQQLLETLVCSDMFMPNKAIIINNPLAAHKQVILSCLSKIAANNNMFVIIQVPDDGKLDRRETLTGFLHKQKALVLCNIPIDKYGKLDADGVRDIGNSIIQMANTLQIGFDNNQTVEYLMYYGGYNLAQIGQELIKLSFLYKGTVINLEQLQAVVDENIQTNSFKFIEHLENGNIGEALRTLDILINRYEINPTEIASILVNKLRLICHVSEYFKDGVIYDYAVLSSMAQDAVDFHNDPEAGKVITYNSYPVYLALQICQKFSREHLLDLYERATQLQLSLMGVSKLPTHTHIIDFILSYCHGKGVLNEQVLL